ncbi:MAG TPA: alpha-hydroxy acid oxidase [Candidatus Limnocylindrales bacterium]|nr:alpha-hydroxy acid oxidase [Candidatus Limnocylindrales bacterium]
MTDLDRFVALHEFEPLARLRMDAVAWDYLAGGAWDELGLAENDAAWRRYRLLPRVLVDVSRIDPSTSFLGLPASMPVAIAPMAAHGLAHPDAEIATARAAASAGVPFVLSTMSTRSMEEVADAAPDGVRLFQLYPQKDPGRSRSLVERAAAAGYRAVVLTVDLPVLGYRERDLRNGFDLDVPLGNFADAGPTHGNHDGDQSGYEALEHQRHLALGWDDVETIRSWSDKPLVLKGILAPADARLAVEHGADAIVVSNHGARQLDRTPAPIDVLESIVEAVDGRVEVWVDGGVRRGLDVLTALALGARGVLIGRPVLWGLAVGGEAGVARILRILRDELDKAMPLLGTATAADVTRQHASRCRQEVSYGEPSDRPSLDRGLKIP